jgi:DNA-binding transcriptional ArsR family regulator
MNDTQGKHAMNTMQNQNTLPGTEIGIDEIVSSLVKRGGKVKLTIGCSGGKVRANELSKETARAHMKVTREWMDEPELFELVSEAMFFDEADSNGRIDVQAREEPDGYGGSGYIEIMRDGRRFRLELAETIL